MSHDRFCSIFCLAAANVIFALLLVSPSLPPPPPPLLPSAAADAGRQKEACLCAGGQILHVHLQEIGSAERRGRKRALREGAEGPASLGGSRETLGRLSSPGPPVLLPSLLLYWLPLASPSSRYLFRPVKHRTRLSIIVPHFSPNFSHKYIARESFAFNLCCSLVFHTWFSVV